MVDFSDRKAIEHWLAGIEPAERRREVAVAMAAREALRVLPLLVMDQRFFNRGPAPVLFDIVLSSFRAAAASWAAGKYPAHVNELRAFAAPAAGITIADASGSDSASASASAAATIAYADPAAAPTAADALAAGARAASTFAGDSAAGSDANSINSGRSGAQVAESPLWPRGVPDWAAQDWQILKTALMDAKEGWEVWTDWYDARLAGGAGHPPNEALEIARVTIPDEIWKQGPAVVNAEIKRLIAEHERGTPVEVSLEARATLMSSARGGLSARIDVQEPPQPEQSLHQRPAAFQFRVVEDKIDALLEDARPIDAPSARDFYDEAKRKGHVLKDGLQRAQADAALRAHVDLLLTRLGESYPEMRPGLMLSVLRSLESDVRAYDGEEGRKELSAALLSNLLDLTESVRDLCAIFPRSREIEAEAVSLGLPMERMPEIRSAIGTVIEKVNASDGVTEGGRQAIDASAADLAHQRDLADEAKQSAYFLVDFANFTRAGLKHLKTTGIVIGQELGGLGTDGWRVFRRGAPKGIERGAAQAGKALIVGGVATLMYALGSDIAALGSMVAAYAPLHEILERTSGPSPETPAPNAPPVDAEGEAPRAPTSRKPTTRRSPAKTPARKRTRP